MTTAFALAIGVGTKNSKGDWLEVFYPQPLLNPAAALIDAATSALGYEGGNAALEAEVKDLKQGMQAVEERARSELGMIKKGETFYQIVEQPAGSKSGDDK